MAKKEQTNGGSKLSIVIGEFQTDNEKKITMPPEKSKKLSIANIAKMKELEETDYLEINVGYHEVVKEGEKTVQRIAKDGKILTSKKSKAKEVETR